MKHTAAAVRMFYQDSQYEMHQKWATVHPHINKFMKNDTIKLNCQLNKRAGPSELKHNTGCDFKQKIA